MATREQVRMMQTQRPFRKFIVRMNSGAIFTVTHPELISCTIDGRSMYLNDTEGTHKLEMLLVEEIKEAEPQPSKTQRNGE